MGAVFAKLFWRVWGAIGIVNFVVGLAGVPGDIGTWITWIGGFMHDPLVLHLAEIAVAAAGFINQGWVRLALVIAGLLMFFWPLRWFWRLRHKAIFRWKRLMAEKVWITRNQAIKLMRASTWGQLKEPLITGSIGLFDNILGRPQIVSGHTENNKKRIRFDAYVDLALRQFGETNKASVRTEDGKTQFEEGALRAYLDKAVERELLAEFGDIPKIKVD